MALFLNVFREHNPIITWPDDPLSPGEWFNSMDMSQWHMVVAPSSFIEAMASGVVWGIPISRWATWHDMAHTMLEDAELSVTCTRWLTGDPPAWNGAVLRNGCLVIDIVDKSGVYVGTSHGGSIFDGLIRTVVEFMEDFIGSTEVVIGDMDVPPEYYEGGTRFTHPRAPYVVYEEGENSPIQTSSWIYSPAKGVQVNAGGHSMTGVNEAISACVAGDTLIDGPNGPERIDVLAERGEPFLVWSLSPDGETVIAATATRAFKKGHAELYEYTLENGASIKATHQHRWWTPDGWRECAEAQIGTKVGVSDSMRFSPVSSIRSLGAHDFYDMHVPVWENYLAQGIWNHNTIQAAFDLLGGLILMGSLGSIVDTLVKPLYEDVVLAWWSVKNFSRAQNTGWERLFEYFQSVGSGDGKAYTIASLMVLRAGFWATKTTYSWKVQVADGLPFLIGDRGLGHFFLDDRIGLVLKGDSAIHVDRARKLELAWDETNPAEWAITIGDDRVLQDPAQRAFGKIETLVAGLRDLGVW